MICAEYLSWGYHVKIYTSRDRTRAWTAQVDYLVSFLIFFPCGGYHPIVKFDAENCIHRAH